MMSAPARACDTAAAANHSSVASLSISFPTTFPQWPWLVYSQLQTSVITILTDQLRKALLQLYDLEKARMSSTTSSPARAGMPGEEFPGVKRPW
jgi:hypothetical protein